MKTLLSLFIAIAFVSCNSKSTEANKAEDDYKKTMDSLTKFADELSLGILTDDIDYSKKECSYWLENKKDEMTGEIKIKSANPVVIGRNYIDEKKYKIEGNTIDISPRIQDKQVAIYFTVKGPKSCVDEDDKINILFENGDRLELKNQAQFNCDSQIVLWFPKSSKKLAQLRDNKIKSMRATVDGSYFDVYFTENNNIHLNMVLTCITE